MSTSTSTFCSTTEDFYRLFEKPLRKEKERILEESDFNNIEDFQVPSKIKSPYYLNHNLLSEKDVDNFFNESLKTVAHINFSNTNDDIVELIFIILESKKLYEAEKHCTAHLIKDLLIKLEEKIKDYRNFFCEMEVIKLNNKIIENLNEYGFYERLITENLKSVLSREPSRYEAFEKESIDGHELTLERLTNNENDLKKKITRAYEQAKSAKFLDHFSLMVRQANISEEIEMKMINFIWKFSTENFINQIF